MFVARPWQAVQAVQLFSTDHDEVVLFLDAMFDYQPLILDDADDDVARLEFRGILATWAVATGTISGDQFERLASPENCGVWRLLKILALCMKR